MFLESDWKQEIKEKMPLQSDSVDGELNESFSAIRKSLIDTIYSNVNQYTWKIRQFIYGDNFRVLIDFFSQLIKISNRNTLKILPDLVRLQSLSMISFSDWIKIFLIVTSYPESSEKILSTLMHYLESIKPTSDIEVSEDSIKLHGNFAYLIVLISLMSSYKSQLTIESLQKCITNDEEVNNECIERLIHLVKMDEEQVNSVLNFIIENTNENDIALLMQFIKVASFAEVNILKQCLINNYEMLLQEPSSLVPLLRLALLRKNEAIIIPPLTDFDNITNSSKIKFHILIFLSNRPKFGNTELKDFYRKISVISNTHNNGLFIEKVLIPLAELPPYIPLKYIVENLGELHQNNFENVANNIQDIAQAAQVFYQFTVNRGLIKRNRQYISIIDKDDIYSQYLHLFTQMSPVKNKIFFSTKLSNIPDEFIHKICKLFSDKPGEIIKSEKLNELFIIYRKAVKLIPKNKLVIELCELAIRECNSSEYFEARLRYISHIQDINLSSTNELIVTSLTNLMRINAKNLTDELFQCSIYIIKKISQFDEGPCKDKMTQYVINNMQTPSDSDKLLLFRRFIDIVTEAYRARTPDIETWGLWSQLESGTDENLLTSLSRMMAHFGAKKDNIIYKLVLTLLDNTPITDKKVAGMSYLISLYQFFPLAFDSHIDELTRYVKESPLEEDKYQLYYKVFSEKNQIMTLMNPFKINMNKFSVVSKINTNNYLLSMDLLSILNQENYKHISIDGLKIVVDFSNESLSGMADIEKARNCLFRSIMIVATISDLEMKMGAEIHCVEGSNLVDASGISELLREEVSKVTTRGSIIASLYGQARMLIQDNHLEGNDTDIFLKSCSDEIQLLNKINLACGSHSENKKVLVDVWISIRSESNQLLFSLLLDELKYNNLLTCSPNTLIKFGRIISFIIDKIAIKKEEIISKSIGIFNEIVSSGSSIDFQSFILNKIQIIVSSVGIEAGPSGVTHQLVSGVGTLYRADTHGLIANLDHKLCSLNLILSKKHEFDESALKYLVELCEKMDWDLTITRSIIRSLSLLNKLSDNDKGSWDSFHENFHERCLVMRLILDGNIAIPDAVKKRAYRHYTTTFRLHPFPTSGLSLENRRKLIQMNCKTIKSLSEEMEAIHASKTGSFIEVHQQNNSGNELKNPTDLHQGLFKQKKRQYISSLGFWKNADRVTLAEKMFTELESICSRVSDHELYYNSTMTVLLDKISELLNGDKNSSRNKKGYSRLFDIGVELLITLAHDGMLDREVSLEFKHLIANKLNELQKLILDLFKDRLKQLNHDLFTKIDEIIADQIDVYSPILISKLLSEINYYREINQLPVELVYLANAFSDISCCNLSTDNSHTSPYELLSFVRS